MLLITCFQSFVFFPTFSLGFSVCCLLPFSLLCSFFYLGCFGFLFLFRFCWARWHHGWVFLLSPVLWQKFSTSADCWHCWESMKVIRRLRYVLVAVWRSLYKGTMDAFVQADLQFCFVVSLLFFLWLGSLFPCSLITC
jgi:hypothetical protein